MMIVSYNFFILLELVYIFSISARPAGENCTLVAGTLKCQGSLPEFKTNSIITIIELSHFSKNVLDLNEILEAFPQVQNISVDDGSILSIIPPKQFNSIKVLLLRNLQIATINRSFLDHFPNIEILNLAGNYLQELDEDFSYGNLKELYLTNNTWNCTKNLEWVFRLKKSIAKDLDKLTCHGPPYPDIQLLPIATYSKDVKENCTFRCDCSLEKVVREPSSAKLYPIIMVNCSDRGLTELPEHFPRYTRILHLEGNSIRNVKALKIKNLYKSLWDLYLDNNEITSITVLEGSYWLSHFRAFSLKGNKLSKLPAFALDNALMKNPHMPDGLRLYLGGNPWRCDCLFIPVFQELVLQKYANQVKDIRNVKCSYVEGDENSLLPIVDLSRSSVCRLSTEYSLQQGLDLLNAVLASLIVFVLGKLAYDYYCFKKTGKLPWIVTKMP